MRDDAAALEDLDIDRVDGVDDPATRKKFLFAKSEDLDEIRSEVNTMAKRSAKLLGRLAKCTHSKEAAADLKKLAGVLGVEDLEFEVAKEEEKPATPAAAAAGQNPATPDLAAAIKGAVVDGLSGLKKSIDSLNEGIGELLEKSDELPEEEEEEDEEDMPPKRARKEKRAVSSQADDDERPVRKAAPKKMGEGLFANFFQ